MPTRKVVVKRDLDAEDAENRPPPSHQPPKKRVRVPTPEPEISDEEWNAYLSAMSSQGRAKDQGPAPPSTYGSSPPYHPTASRDIKPFGFFSENT